MSEVPLVGEAWALGEDSEERYPLGEDRALGED